MAADNRAVDGEFQPDENIAAEAFHDGCGLSFPGGGWKRGLDRAPRQTIEDLRDQRQALLDFADADPDAGVDVAFLPQRNLELQLVIGGIAKIAAGVEIAATSASSSVTTPVVTIRSCSDGVSS